MILIVGVGVLMVLVVLVEIEEVLLVFLVIASSMVVVDVKNFRKALYITILLFNLLLLLFEEYFGFV